MVFLLMNKLSDAMGKVKNIESIVNTYHCFLDYNMLNMIVSFMNQYIDSLHSNYFRNT